MPSKAAIEDFMAQHRLVFIGVSHDPKDFSVAVYHQLGQSGLAVLAPGQAQGDGPGFAWGQVEDVPQRAVHRLLPAGRQPLLP